MQFILLLIPCETVTRYVSENKYGVFFTYAIIHSAAITEVNITLKTLIATAVTKVTQLLFSHKQGKEETGNCK
jgi:hypothetical protein